MGNLLFSPSGRIGPAQFMSGVTILVVIGLVLTLLPVFIPALTVLGILALVTLWCWVVLWVKRYHDAGKSGWMCLIPIVVYLIVGGIASYLISQMFVDPDVAEAIAEATADGDIGELMKLSGSGGMTKVGALINAAATAAISYLIAMLFNNMTKHDEHDNQFGPESSTGSTFD